MTLTNHVANGCIVGLENKTKAFFLRTYPCINDYQNPDLPALLVCLMYLDQMDVSIKIVVNQKRKSSFQKYIISGTLIVINSTL